MAQSYCQFEAATAVVAIGNARNWRSATHSFHFWLPILNTKSYRFFIFILSFSSSVRISVWNCCVNRWVWISERDTLPTSFRGANDFLGSVGWDIIYLHCHPFKRQRVYLLKERAHNWKRGLYLYSAIPRKCYLMRILFVSFLSFC